MAEFTIIYKNSLDHTKLMTTLLTTGDGHTLQDALTLLRKNASDVIVFPGKHYPMLKEEIDAERLNTETTHAPPS